MIAVGFRVKSGFAIAVTPKVCFAPSAVSRRDEMIRRCPRRVSHHDGLFRTKRTRARSGASRLWAVRRKSIAALLKDTGAIAPG